MRENNIFQLNKILADHYMLKVDENHKMLEKLKLQQKQKILDESSDDYVFTKRPEKHRKKKAIEKTKEYKYEEEGKKHFSYLYSNKYIEKFLFIYIRWYIFVPMYK